MEAEEETPLVLDPLAAQMAGAKALKSARSRQQPAPKDSGRKIKVNMMAIRTKWFDDQLEASLGMPVGTAVEAENYLGATATPGNAPRQCVVLGAGMDSRPWRLKLPASLRWFEVDREDVLQAKEDLLAVVGAEYEVLSPMHRSTSVNTLLQDKIGRIDHHMVAVQYPLRTYSRQAVAADLGDPAWKAALLNAGFDPSKPTVWLAEGLLMYLEPSRVDALLKELKEMSAPGSALLTVSVTDDVVTNIKTKGTDSDLMATWQFGCPADPKPWLASLGWTAAVVGTRASLAKALGLAAEICGFETDESSPKNGRSLFIAASVE
jgi:O-methyltransferase involved in polyketide biosynthesis